MEHIQKWIHEKKWVDPNVDDHAFIGGRVSLSWVGHWEYPRYKKAFDKDLVLIPLPDFGEGSKTGQGSWNWGITTNCKHPGEAFDFIRFLMKDEEILKMANANGAVPATHSAIGKSKNYGPDGPLHLYVVQLTGGFSVPRPATPAYPVITDVFQNAFDDIRHGVDISSTLNQAVEEIDTDIRNNQGYPFRDG